MTAYDTIDALMRPTESASAVSQIIDMILEG